MEWVFWISDRGQDTSIALLSILWDSIAKSSITVTLLCTMLHHYFMYMFNLGIDINVQVVEHAKHCTQRWLEAYSNPPILHQQISFFQGNCFEMNIPSMCRYDRIYIGTYWKINYGILYLCWYFRCGLYWWTREEAISTSSRWRRPGSSHWWWAPSHWKVEMNLISFVWFLILYL